jgi:hypothetical protein
MAWGPRTYGFLLRPAVQEDALSRFVHRSTRNNPHRFPLPVQFASDNEWLRFTLFHTCKDGTLDNRYNSCISLPTWPDNPELRSVIVETK